MEKMIGSPDKPGLRGSLPIGCEATVLEGRAFCRLDIAEFNSGGGDGRPVDGPLIAGNIDS
jgi:hypothetical protein